MAKSGFLVKKTLNSLERLSDVFHISFSNYKKQAEMFQILFLD